MKITNIDAATGSNTELTVTQEEFTEIIGEILPVQSMAEAIAEKQALKDAALAKLTALGLTEDEAKAIIG
jgi:hypothetical protein